MGWGSECRSFNCPWCFISTKCGSSISAKFLVHTAHAVCLCALVTILDPLLDYIFYVLFNVPDFYSNQNLKRKEFILGYTEAEIYS
jgi:hypothetical protein